MRQALHRAEVCLATIVAADNTCQSRWHKTNRLSEQHDSYYTLALQSYSSKQNSFARSQTKCITTILWNYLRWAACWIYQILASHLDCLIGSGKLNWVNKTLLTCLTVGIWNANQVSSLEIKKGRKKIIYETMLNLSCLSAKFDMWLQTEFIQKLHWKILWTLPSAIHLQNLMKTGHLSHYTSKIWLVKTKPSCLLRQLVSLEKLFCTWTVNGKALTIINTP